MLQQTEQSTMYQQTERNTKDISKTLHASSINYKCNGNKHARPYQNTADLGLHISGSKHTRPYQTLHTWTIAETRTKYLIKTLQTWKIAEVNT